MKLDEIIRRIEVGKNHAAAIECEMSVEYPGYVRQIDIMGEYLVRIEWEVYGHDEGDLAFYVSYENWESLIVSLEQYLGKKMENWTEVDRLGYYPESSEKYDLTSSHKKITKDIMEHHISLPIGGNRTWIKEGYWKEIYERLEKG